MDGPTFDRIARTLAGRDSRRGWLRGAGLAAVAVAGRAAVVPGAAANGDAARASRCAGDGDCGVCRSCDGGTCRNRAPDYVCANGVGHCKKGRCHVEKAKLEATANPPCVAATARGFAPGTDVNLVFSGPCRPTNGLLVPASSDGEALAEICSNCRAACPGKSHTSITVKARGVAAKNGKQVALKKKLKHVDCVGSVPG